MPSTQQTPQAQQTRPGRVPSPQADTPGPHSKRKLHTHINMRSCELANTYKNPHMLTCTWPHVHMHSHTFTHMHSLTHVPTHTQNLPCSPAGPAEASMKRSPRNTARGTQHALDSALWGHPQPRATSHWKPDHGEKRDAASTRGKDTQLGQTPGRDRGTDHQRARKGPTGRLLSKDKHKRGFPPTFTPGQRLPPGCPQPHLTCSHFLVARCSTQRSL